MYRTRALLVLVGLLVVGAGCVGGVDLPGVPADGGDGGDDGDDGEDGDDGNDRDNSEDSGADDSDDGAVDDSADGGTDDSSDGDGGDRDAGDGVFLVENRTAALLEAGSYTTVWQMRVTEGGEVTDETRYTTAVDAVTQRSIFGMETTDGGVTSSDFETYHADGTNYQRYGAGEEATYAVNAGEFTTQSSLFLGTTYVTSESYLEDFDVVGTETYDGDTVTRYERTTRPTYLVGQAQADEDVRWTGFTYVVLVDEDGLVRSEGWTSEGVDADDVRVTVEYSYSLTGVGSTTVTEPDWVGDARAESAASLSD